MLGEALAAESCVPPSPLSPIGLNPGVTFLRSLLLRGREGERGGGGEREEGEGGGLEKGEGEEGDEEGESSEVCVCAPTVVTFSLSPPPQCRLLVLSLSPPPHYDGHQTFDQSPTASDLSTAAHNTPASDSHHTAPPPHARSITWRWWWSYELRWLSYSEYL